MGALAHAKACLLANHGQLTTGPVDRALELAKLVEEQAFWYWGVLAIGVPQVLDDEQMAEVPRLFTGYGQQTPVDQIRGAY